VHKSLEVKQYLGKAKSHGDPSFFVSGVGHQGGGGARAIDPDQGELHIYINVCVCGWVGGCMWVCVCVCVCMHLCVYIYIYMHTYTYINIER